MFNPRALSQSELENRNTSQEEKKETNKWARLSDIYQNVTIFKGNSDKLGITLENLSPHNAVNKAVVNSSDSSFLQAVRLMI